MFDSCGSLCTSAITCENYEDRDSIICAAVCIEGCFCPAGMLDLDGVCIHPADCPGQGREQLYVYIPYIILFEYQSYSCRSHWGKNYIFPAMHLTVQSKKGGRSLCSLCLSLVQEITMLQCPTFLIFPWMSSSDKCLISSSIPR